MSDGEMELVSSIWGKCRHVESGNGAGLPFMTMAESQEKNLHQGNPSRKQVQIQKEISVEIEEIERVCRLKRRWA